METKPPSESAWKQRCTVTAVCVGLGLAVFAISLTRCLRLQWDFSHFYRDAAYTWLHGGELNPKFTGPLEEQRQLPFYLPAVTLWLAPFAAGGIWPAALIWASGQALSAGVSWGLLWNWLGGVSPRRRVGVFLVLTLMSAPALYEAAKFNQLTFPVLVLMLVGVRAVTRGRLIRGGALLAIPAFLKLLPAIVVPWLASSRRWSAIAAFAAVMAVLALGPAFLIWGVDQTVSYHRQWWNLNVGGPAARGMVAEGQTLREHFTDHRNQSLAAVLARWFSADQPQKMPWQPAQLSETACVRIARAVSGLLLLALAALTWRTAAARDEASTLRIFSLWMVAMVAVSPLLRQYYLAWALPALFAAASVLELPTARRLALAALIAWVAAMFGWLWPLARLAGAHLAALLILLALLGIAHWRISRPEKPQESLSAASHTG